METENKTLGDALTEADILIGLAGSNIVTGDDISKMAAKPIIFALSLPEPEIDPSTVELVAPDAVIATGLASTPNMINDKLVFPFIFRAVLDTRTPTISYEMKLAAAEAIASLAKTPVPEHV